MVVKNVSNGEKKAKKSRKSVKFEALCRCCGQVATVHVMESDVLTAAAQIYADRRKTRGGGAPMVPIKCQHCGEFVIGAHNIGRHERACAKNPANRAAAAAAGR